MNKRISKALWCLYAVTITAFTTSVLADDDGGTFNVVIENDKIAGTDRRYTNGFRASWLSAADQSRSFGRTLARWITRGDEFRLRDGWAFGQSIFTPADIEATEPLPDQHPYSAWLHGEYAIVIERPGRLDRLSIQAGLAGESAGGEFVQNEIHRLMGVERARGWDNALKDEFGLIVSYDRKFRSRRFLSLGPVATDIAPSVGASVGNIYTGAHAGAMLRVGTGLRDDYGPPRVRPALAGGGSFTPQDASGWYAFAGVDARWVAHNFFLEGSLFRDDPGVTPESFVVDYQAGVVLQRGRYQASMTVVRRSNEYESQQRAQVFAAFALAVRL